MLLILFTCSLAVLERCFYDNHFLRVCLSKTEHLLVDISFQSKYQEDYRQRNVRGTLEIKKAKLDVNIKLLNQDGNLISTSTWKYLFTKMIKADVDVK